MCALVMGQCGAEPSSPRPPSRFPLSGEPVTLVRNGRARAVLVVAQGSTKESGAAGTGLDDRAAAELLREWIESMTGSRLPIVSAPAGRVPIYVGRAAVEAGLRIDDIRSDSSEGLRVLVETDRVSIAGQNPTSTFKAAVVFLEEIGCRWYIEGDVGRHFPEDETLRVQPVDIVDRPGMALRRLWGGDGWARETPWKLWNGAGGVDYRFGHDWRVIGGDDFGQHPEWFALDAEGTRVEGPWLNSGNAELREVFAQRLAASLTPGSHASISPPDRILPDFSAESVRLDVRGAIEPMAQRQSMSDRFFDFANDIARRIGRSHPETRLGIYAYSDYSQPPVRIDRLEPNLCVWIAPFRYSRYHRIGDPRSPSRSRLADEIERWHEIASCLGYRTYNYNLAEAMTPFAKLSTWAHDIPYLADRGLVGISIEAFPSWDLSAPSLYLALRLAYSPDTDPQAILDDFYRGFYGPAAGPMRRYWQVLDEGWSTLESESGSIYSLHLVFTQERLDRLERALAGAERASRYDARRAHRVALARSGFRNALDFVSIRKALHEGDVRSAVAAYEIWLERAQRAADSGAGHTYTVRYMERFIGRYLDALQSALDATGTGAQVTVMPDDMEMAYETDLARNRRTWRLVQTRSATLEQQGLPERFEVMYYRTTFDLPAQSAARLVTTAIDGIASFSINTTPVLDSTDPAPGIAGKFAALTPHEIDISDLVRPGRNELTIRVDHSTYRRMKLGGIVGPVFVIHTTTGS